MAQQKLPPCRAPTVLLRRGAVPCLRNPTRAHLLSATSNNASRDMVHSPAEGPEESTTGRKEESDRKDPKKRGLVRSLGLGVITGAADADCSAIGTYASAGAQFGLSFASGLMLRP